MALAFVQSNNADVGGGATTIAVTLTGVGAGNLIVCTVANGTTTLTSISDGTSNLTLGTDQVATALTISVGWLLAANSGNRTYTATFGASATGRKITVSEYSYTGTVALDVTSYVSTGTTPTTPTTAQVTTTGTDELVVAMISDNNNSAGSAFQINGVNADRSIELPGFHTCDRILTATMTNGAGTCALSGGNGIAFSGSIVSFKAAAGNDLSVGVGALGEPVVGGSTF